MKIHFYKYHGTGNDFVVIDNRDLTFPKKDTKLVKKLCDRRFGIGGDGLILLENDKISDFKMLYFNADGNQGSMCGNGGRCIVAFAKQLGIIDCETTFRAVDGEHVARISADGTISLKMIDVDHVQISDNHAFLNTGSPHHVELVTDLRNYDVVGKGRSIRNSMYGEAGSNVNFIEVQGKDVLDLRTYERGVEDETFACGTGATAAAIAMHVRGLVGSNVELNVKGGRLSVSFDEVNGKFVDVFLSGPATFVFKGEIEC
ncbi:MAG: diaminopimelate epimerase [Flavobacterium sp.]|nr:diaminopimelate epimerase [Flavobacterium sp.]